MQLENEERNEIQIIVEKKYILRKYFVRDI